MEAVPGYLSLHQSAESLTLKWTPNQLMNGTLGDSELEKRWGLWDSQKPGKGWGGPAWGERWVDILSLLWEAGLTPYPDAKNCRNRLPGESSLRSSQAWHEEVCLSQALGS